MTDTDERETKERSSAAGQPAPGEDLDWVQRSDDDSKADTRLERTTLRWHAKRWYVLTADKDQGNAAVRVSGPYRMLREAEDRLRTETVGDDPGAERGGESDSRLDAIYRTICEGLTERLYEASKTWVEHARQLHDSRKRSGDGTKTDSASTPRWQAQAHTAGTTDNSDEKLWLLHEQVLEAAEAIRIWNET